MMSMFRKVATVYSALGSIWLTVSLILLLLNGLAWYWLSRPKPTNPVVQRHGEVIYQAYPQRERAQVDRLLKEFFTQPSLVYEPYTQFKERPRNLDNGAIQERPQLGFSIQNAVPACNKVHHTRQTGTPFAVKDYAHILKDVRA